MLVSPQDSTLIRPVSVGAVHRQVTVRIGGAEYLCGLVDVIDDQVAEIAGPRDLCHGVDELVGQDVELRWRTLSGITRGDGKLEAIEATGLWVVRLARPPQLVDERLFRRVGIHIDAELAAFVGSQPRTARTTTLNLSLGGAALVTPPEMSVPSGTPVVVAFDPKHSGILAGALVVADPAEAECLRIRYEWISCSGQDQLVALINRNELKLAR